MINTEAIKDKKLVIATPFYEMKGFSPYITSLVASLELCWRLGVKVDYWTLSGDAYVDHAKNTLLTRFYKSTDFTHLLLIDSDEAWNADSIIRMLDRNVELIGGAYPLKNHPERWGVKVNTVDGGFPAVDPATGLISASLIPGGFMLISREAISRFVSFYPGLKYEDDSVGGDEIAIDFFDCPRVNGRRWGEDFTFCQRFLAAGGKIWLEPNIDFSHYGVRPSTGNYHEFLLGRPGGSECGLQSIGNLKGRHPGETAWIVGKGPSIAYLLPGHFGKGPVIALNEAILRVEDLNLPNPIYSMQKDGALTDGRETWVEPKGATLLVHKWESARFLREYKPRFIFDAPKDFDLPVHSFSAACAIETAKLMGCSKVVFVCFDATVNGDYRTWEPSGSGEEVLKEYHPTETQYPKQRLALECILNSSNLGHDWIIPKEDDAK